MESPESQSTLRTLNIILSQSTENLHLLVFATWRDYNLKSTVPVPVPTAENLHELPVALAQRCVQAVLQRVQFPVGLSRIPMWSNFLCHLEAAKAAGSLPHNDKYLDIVRQVLAGGNLRSVVQRIHSAVVAPYSPSPLCMDAPSTYTTSKTLCVATRPVDLGEFANSAYPMLDRELGVIVVDIPSFYDTFMNYGRGKAIAREFVIKCKTDASFLDWKAHRLLNCTGVKSQVGIALVTLFEALKTFVLGRKSPVWASRRFQDCSGNPHLGHGITQNSCVVLFDSLEDDQGQQAHWDQVLVVGELKDSVSLDTRLDCWIPLAGRAREVFRSQPDRRFVLGFTICGHFFRAWLFDRGGAIASKVINIVDYPMHFIECMVFLLSCDEAALGLDPTIGRDDQGRRTITVPIDGVPTTVILRRLLHSPSRIVGRETVCWEGYVPARGLSVVVKDSWVAFGSDEVRILRTHARNLKYVCRFIHGEKVRVDGAVDDVAGCVRKGINPATGSHRGMIPQEGQHDPPTDPAALLGLPLPQGRILNQQRLHAQALGGKPFKNRVHQRVVLLNSGIPIVGASSPAALVLALIHAITGHRSLYINGVLHRDISVNNLLIDEGLNGEVQGCLIDLDYALNIFSPDGSQFSRIGTRAFMSRAVLLGSPASVYSDLESFVWVLYWVAVSYDGPGESNRRHNNGFERWHNTHCTELAYEKASIVFEFTSWPVSFLTGHYRCLGPLLVNLMELFKLDSSAYHPPVLYERMLQLFHNAHAELAYYHIK